MACFKASSLLQMNEFPGWVLTPGTVWPLPKGKENVCQDPCPGSSHGTLQSHGCSRRYVVRGWMWPLGVVMTHWGEKSVFQATVFANASMGCSCSAGSFDFFIRDLLFGCEWLANSDLWKLVQATNQRTWGRRSQSSLETSCCSLE